MRTVLQGVADRLLARPYLEWYAVRLQGLADRLLARYPQWYAADNRFRSRFRMDRAHVPIVAAASETLTARGGNVLDLGCGNGALVRKIHDANPRTVPFGIDVTELSIAHAHLLLPAFAEHFVVGDMFENDAPWADDRRYALVLLAPARLLETTPARAAALRERLQGRSDALVVYAYGESLTRHGDLTGLCRAAGLRLLALSPAARAGLAEVR
jgi:SAM-dependent methyltransferase